MKPTQKNWLTCLTLAGSLLVAPLLVAQDAPADSETVSTNSSTSAAEGTETTTNSTAIERSDEHNNHPQPIVLIGQDVELKAEDSAEAVVVIWGSAKIHGKVRNAVVVIGGNAEVDGEVNDAVVAVLGNVRLKPGARIGKDAVAVMGTLSLAPDVSVNGNAVSVGGKLDLAPGATVRGQKTTVGLPMPLMNMEWLTKWLKYCVLEFRPLAPQVGWVWVVAGVFFLVYLFIAAFFPRPVQVCADMLVRRPASTFLIGLLTKLFVPVVYLILTVTVVGVVVVPFVWAALVVAAMIGKVALLERLGLQVGRGFASGFQKPVAAFLIGALLLTLLYLVPFLGLLTSMIFSTWGLGCAVAAVSGSMRREMPQKPAALPSSGFPVEPVAVATATTFSAPTNPSSAVSSSPVESAPEETRSPDAAPQNPAPVQPARAAVPPVYPPALSFPRAGFWERLIAGFLDFIVVAILAGIAHTPLRMSSGPFNGPPIFFIVSLAYFVGMWTWKGTTIGGIVLKLQVIRAEGGELTFLVAVVRALAGAFSIAVLFLGFFWIAWDREKQGWHDKIAGTVVIRLPRSTPLVCL